MDRRPLFVSIGLVVAVAGWWWSALSTSGFLADDYLLRALLRTDLAHGPDAVSVDWSRVAGDFTSSWFGEGRYWRPLVTALNAADYTIHGANPRGFLWTNLVLHLGVTLLAFRLIGRLVVRQHDCGLMRWGALVAAAAGGLVVGLHVVVAEPVLWISARTSSLEVFWRLAALLSFVGWLERRSLGGAFAVTGCSVLALMSKESAFCLPFLFLWLDVHQRVWRSLVERLRIHGPFVALWLAYAGWRYWLFGAFLGESAEQSYGGMGQALATLRNKLVWLVAPHAEFEAIATQDLGLWLALSLAVLLVVLTLRRGAVQVWMALGAVVAALLPSFATPLAGFDATGTRMLYGAVIPLAAALGLLVRQMPGRVERWSAGGLVLLWIVVQLPLKNRIADDYCRAVDRLVEARESLLAIGAQTSERTVGLLTMPFDRGAPPLHPAGWSALIDTPVVAQPVRALNLSFVASDHVDVADLSGDAAPLRVLLDAEIPIVAWDSSSFSTLTRPPRVWPVDAAPRVLDPASSGEFRLVAALPAADVGMVRITLQGKDSARGGELRLVYSSGQQGAPIAFAQGGADGERAVYEIDLSRSLGEYFAVLNRLSTTGCMIRSAAAVEKCEYLPVVPRLEVGAEDSGARYDWQQWLEEMRAPDAPPGHEVRLVLIGPVSSCALRFDADGRVLVTAKQHDLIRYGVKLSSHGRHAFYFETLPGSCRPGVARSDLDFVELR